MTKSDDELIEAEIQRELSQLPDDDLTDDDTHEDTSPIHDSNIFDYSLDFISDLQQYFSHAQHISETVDRELEECDELMHHSSNVVTNVDEDLFKIAQQEGVDIETLKKNILNEIEQQDAEDDQEYLTLIEQHESILYDKSVENTAAFLTEPILPSSAGEVNLQSSRNERQSSAVKNKYSEEACVEAVPLASAEVVPVDEIQQLERQFLRELFELDKRQKEVLRMKLEEVKETKRTQTALAMKIQELRKEKQMALEQERINIESVLHEQEALMTCASINVSALDILVAEHQKTLELIEKKLNVEKAHLKVTMDSEIMYQAQRKGRAAVKIQAVVRGFLCRQRNKEDINDLKENIRYMWEKKWYHRTKEIEELKNMKELEEKRKKEEEEKRIEEEEAEKRREEAFKKQQELIQKQEQEQRKEEERKEKEKQRLEKERQKQLEKEKQLEKKRQKEQEKEERKREKALEKEKKLAEKQRKKYVNEAKESKQSELKNVSELPSSIRKENSTEIVKNVQMKTLAEEIKSQEQQLNNKKTVSMENLPHEMIKLAKTLNISPINDQRITVQKVETHTIPQPHGSSSTELQECPNNGQPLPQIEQNNAVLIDAKFSEDTLTDEATEEALSIINMGKVDTLPLDKLPTPPKEPKNTKTLVRHLPVKPSHHSIEPKEPLPIPSVSVLYNIEQVKKDWGHTLPTNIDQRRLQWIKECTFFSKLVHDCHGTKRENTRRVATRPVSGSKQHALDEHMVLVASGANALRQVTTLQLQQPPAHLPSITNIHILTSCPHLTAVQLHNCSLTSTDRLEHCKSLQYIDLQHNNIQSVTLKDLPQLGYLDLSHNSLRTFIGFEGCPLLCYLNLSFNSITRVSDLGWFGKLQHLDLSHNQITNSRGLLECPTIQVLNISDNTLLTIDSLQGLPLLRALDLSRNDLMKVPDLPNNVLLQTLKLQGNSISLTSSLTLPWLPLLQELDLSQNSVTLLSPMNNLLLLQALNLKQNQLMDYQSLLEGLTSLRCLHTLNIQDNYICQQPNFTQTITERLPFLTSLNDCQVKSDVATCTRTEFEELCLAQCSQFQNLDRQYRSALADCQSVSQHVNIHVKYFEQSHNMAIDFRSTHEYGLTMDPAKVIDIDFTVRPDLDVDIFLTKHIPPSVVHRTSHSEKIQSKVKFEAALPHGRQQESSSSQSPFNETQPETFSSISTVEHHSKTLVAAHNSSTEQAKNFSTPYHINGEHNSANTTSSHVNVHKMSHDMARSSRDKFNAMLYADNNKVDASQQAVNAVKIQAWWRGVSLRTRLNQALDYIKLCDMSSSVDNFEELDPDIDAFVMEMDTLDLDQDFGINTVPELPQPYPILTPIPSRNSTTPTQQNGHHKTYVWGGIPPKPTLPPLNLATPPPHPNLMTPLTQQIHDSHRSNKVDSLVDEWHFNDERTAKLLIERKKKMRDNSDKKRKFLQLDAKQRLEFFNKLESLTQPKVSVPNRKILPRQEYFKAREQEYQSRQMEDVMSHKVHRTFEWLHTQVGDYEIESSRINKPKVPQHMSENNIHELSAHLYSDVDSVSSQAHTIKSDTKPYLPPIGRNASGSSSWAQPKQPPNRPRRKKLAFYP